MGGPRLFVLLSDIGTPKEVTEKKMQQTMLLSGDASESQVWRSPSFSTVSVVVCGPSGVGHVDRSFQGLSCIPFSG